MSDGTTLIVTCKIAKSNEAKVSALQQPNSSKLC